MKRKGRTARARKARLSVSLDEADFNTLHKIAISQQPPLSDSYVAAVAIKRFLRSTFHKRVVIGFAEKSG